MASVDKVVSLLDYGGGNVRSAVNAIKSRGFEVKWIKEPSDIDAANRILFPGVGAFGSAMEGLREKGFVEPLKKYIKSGKPFMGICIGMQCLFESSAENEGVEGLGIIPGKVDVFKSTPDSPISIPHMGWNGLKKRKHCVPLSNVNEENDKLYFVHSYIVPYKDSISEYVSSTTNYGDFEFVSSVCFDNIFATQFHPEKSGTVGLELIGNFLNADQMNSKKCENISNSKTQLGKRIIACLDVRSNDAGDLIVTKGDQYDVRQEGKVRNLGKPVELAGRYYQEGADEITFLNITSFRECPVTDLPMLEVLKKTSENVFVPLTIGGGIRDITDPDGTFHSAVDVAALYFRSGADKVSIGSDAVYAAEDYYKNEAENRKTSAIEMINKSYGRQAVVVSVDPKRVYVEAPEKAPNKHVIQTKFPGPNGEGYCWYQCTVKGGRESRDLDVHALVVACEKMGAGEILLNCMDKDGMNNGFDLELILDTKKAVGIPVIASSGAGCEQHFIDCFTETNADAGLAAGIFHRKEVAISSVKKEVKNAGFPIRF